MAENGNNGRTVGTVSSVIGPVVDFSFTGEHIPEIYHAVYVDMQDGSRLTCEIQQHLGGGKVRAVAMSSTDGMRRGMEAYSDLAPITVPVGPATLGRIFDVTGQAIDNRGDVDTQERYPIHRNPPSFSERSTQAEVFVTGVKVIDLSRSFYQGWQDGHLRWGWCRQNCGYPGIDPQRGRVP